MKKNVLLSLLLLTSSVFCFSNKGITPTNYLNDYTGSLTDGQVQSLNSKLSEYEKSTGIEIAIAIVETLDGQEIDVYKTELFSEWGVGKKGADNGLLLVVAPNEHKYGVETGYGLEGFLPDAICYRIAESTMPDNFRAGDYYSGINGFIDGVLEDLGKISWEERLEMKKKEDAALKAQLARIWDGFLDFLFYALILGIVIFLVILLIRYNTKKRVFGVYKDDYVRKYMGYLEETNNDLKKLDIDLLSANQVFIKKIKNSKTEQECVTNYHDSISSFLEPRNKIRTINNIKRELDYNKSLRIKIDSSAKINKVEYKIETPYSYSYNNSVDELETILFNIQNDNEKLKTFLSDLQTYNLIISFNTKNESVDKEITEAINKFENEVYQIDKEVINEYGRKVKASLTKFYSIEQKFDNLDLLKKAFDYCAECEESLSNYIRDVLRKNVEYKQKVVDIKNHKEKLNGYTEKLIKLSKDSDVSKGNKTSIEELLLLFAAFLVTDNVLETHDRLIKLYRDGDSLIKGCNSDIDSENDNRRRIKEAEERKKRDDEYQRQRSSSYNSYSSSSSYSSYDSSSSSSSSSSSFSDFGGGSSGGGGCSGGW